MSSSFCELCILVPKYRSWSPLFISTKISTINFLVTSLWCHIRQNGKNPKKWQNFLLTIKILGTSDFHRFRDKGFLELKLNIKKKNVKKSIAWIGCTTPCKPILNDYSIPRGGGGIFIFAIIGEGWYFYIRYNKRKGCKTMSQNRYFF